MVQVVNTVASLFACSGRFKGARGSLHSPRLKSSRWPLMGGVGCGRPSSCTSTSEVQSTELDEDGTATKWLVVGDGDLSYSSMIAGQMDKSNVRLIASVLEEESVHNQVYQRSRDNTASISSYPMHVVKFGVDATRLQNYFSDDHFDCIEFNFPHWRGKTNARRNRQLLDEFLGSASKVLKPGGELRVALCDGQGGMESQSIQEWRQSWMVPYYAAEHGLLLRNLEPYQPIYSLSSHRGVDRPFDLGDAPHRYTFVLPDGDRIDDSLQISCRHELRVMLHPEKLERSSQCFDSIVHGDALFNLCQEFIPDGIRFEVPARHFLTPEDQSHHHVPLAVFLLNYSGERKPLTRAQADHIRAGIEACIIERWQLDIARGGRMVSRPYPYKLLPRLIRDYS